MADMFGAPIGIGAAEDDIRKNVLGALNAGKILGEIEAAPFELQMKKAQTRVYEATAAEKEQEVAATKRMMELMQGGSAGSAEDPTTQLDTIGTAALAAGKFKLGSDLLGRASTMRTQAATAATAEVRQGLMEARTRKLEAERVGGLTGSVVDQASWDRVRPELEAAGLTGIPTDFASAAPILSQVTSASMTAAQQNAARERELERVARGAHWKAQEKTWDAQVARAHAAVALSRERLERLKKNGGALDQATIEARNATRDLRKAQKLALEGKEQAQHNRSAVPPLAVDRKIGAVYNTPRGKMMWQGQGWVPAPAAATADTDDDDDGDEE